MPTTVIGDEGGRGAKTRTGLTPGFGNPSDPLRRLRFASSLLSAISPRAASLVIRRDSASSAIDVGTCQRDSASSAIEIVGRPPQSASAAIHVVAAARVILRPLRLKS